MNKILLVFLIVGGAVGCGRNEEPEVAVPSPVMNPSPTNQSTGMGDVEGTIGGGAQRTGEPEQPHPPSGSR